MDRRGFGFPLAKTTLRWFPPFGWTLFQLALLGWQGWLTLSLFAVDGSWQALIDDRPIVSGRHPLHLYHGFLGAQSLYHHRRLSCYDPSFQAGYPKTPVFDAGSRPAELFLSLTGGTYRPAAYKIGLALCCWSVPIFFFVGGSGLGLRREQSCLAALLGFLLFWGAPCQDTLVAGDLDLLLGDLAAAAYIGLLTGFDRAPTHFGWLGLTFTCCLGWFTHPLLFLLLVPLSLLYYLTAGARHGLGWHCALAASTLIAMLANQVWLGDWLVSWWLRLPVEWEHRTLIHRTIRTFWESDLWGTAQDRILGTGLMISASIGVWILNQNGQRAAARLFGLGAGGFLLAALAGLGDKSIGRLGTAHLLIPALLLAVFPAVVAVTAMRQSVARQRRAWPRAAACLAPLLLCFGTNSCDPRVWGDRFLRAAPMQIGLTRDQERLVQWLRTNTDRSARILWEEKTVAKDCSHWTALLPILTGRAYLGGLGPALCIEHSFPRLIDDKLAGQPVARISDTGLQHFCKQYNVGWVVCSSDLSAERFRNWQDAKEVKRAMKSPVAIFAVRQQHSFVLKGQARSFSADRGRIILTDVFPQDGTVVLSMHFQNGTRATPSRVHVEREPDAQDPIPFVRLRLNGPVARLVLVEEGF
jgi:hypothetical protein